MTLRVLLDAIAGDGMNVSIRDFHGKRVFEYAHCEYLDEKDLNNLGIYLNTEVSEYRRNLNWVNIVLTDLI